MEKKIETVKLFWVIWGVYKDVKGCMGGYIKGLYRDNGKENGNYYSIMKFIIGDI